MKAGQFFLRAAIAAVSALSIAGCGRVDVANNVSETRPMMTPSVTYLYLLRNTPFFKGLGDDQLRWAIKHSREWEAAPRTVVATCDPAAADNHDIWILLDGGWQVETNGRTFPAGHADPGKWFSGAVTTGDCRLVTTEHSYVMKITRTDMDDMLARGFAFTNHLEQGEAYYSTIFPD
ncbi:hypothetical protein [Burkholderia sp. Ac-20365]|uniref:hypothetical protein n=1 Tax=Burkholderia sp. Ac-20365 TaxID=2703897 RepID=UPI00197B5AEE|nr:hypothetical protein [Burkholderia sp. Ac-20365]